MISPMHLSSRARVALALVASLAGAIVLACNPAPLGLTPTPSTTDTVVTEVTPEAPSQGQAAAPTAPPASAGPCPRILSSEQQTAIVDVVRRYQEALAALDRARVASTFTLRLQTQAEGAVILSTIDEARSLNLRGGPPLVISAIQSVDDGAVVILEGSAARLQLVQENEAWKIQTTRYRTSAQQSRVLGLGTPVDVAGDLRVTFTRIAYADSVEDRTSKTQVRPTPSGIFLVAFYNVQNMGREPKRPALELNSKLMVFDQDGRRWEYADEQDKGNISGRFAIEDGKESPDRPLGPGFSMDTAVAFEVPANASGLCVPVGQLRLVIPPRG